MVSLSSVGVLVLFCIGICYGQRKGSRNIPVGADLKQPVNFDCPEEFGYYPHPSDCTQYYVCVFGGALLESCTGGLMYSHELQTCDWPRNVGCDGLEISAPPSSVAVSTSSARGRDRDRERERDRDEPRARYSPPPPPQPAAVVTSRGQSRQLHHTQQEIIKQQQQQQLYADAEETLPPAEEIESDRQQRVYRGQPSTVGQVQRDRDGLRHSNAIPSYTGRGEKIGVISFGTQNQHYSRVTDDDDLLTNDLTIKRRRKRQVQKSRPQQEEHGWQGHRNRISRINLSLTSPPPVQNQNHKNVFKPSQPQTNSSDDFKPFVPNYKVNPQTPSSTATTILENNLPLPSTPPNRQNNYSYLTIGKPVQIPEEQLDARRLTLEPAYSNIVTKKESVQERTSPNNTTRTITRHKHITEVVTKSYPKIIHKPFTEVVTKPYPKIETSTAESVRSDETEVNKPNEEEKHVNEEKSEEESSSYQEDEDEDEHFNPPPEFFRTESRYADIRNPFADPDFDFDKFLDKLRGPTQKPPKVKIIPKSQQGVARVPDKANSAPDPVAVPPRMPVPFTRNNGRLAVDVNGNPIAHLNINRALQPLPELQPLPPLPQYQPLPPLPQYQSLPQYKSLPPVPQLQQLPPLPQYQPAPQVKPPPTPQQLKPLQTIQAAAIINEYFEKNPPRPPQYANPNPNLRAPLQFVNHHALQKANVQPVNIPRDLDKTSSIQSRPIVNVYYEKSTSKPIVTASHETSSVRPAPASTINPQVEKANKPPPKEYYYEYESVTPQPKKMFSSQIKTTIKKENKVVVKKPTVEYEYYYDDYDYAYPDTKNKQRPNKNNQENKRAQPNVRLNNTGGEVKYSARYQGNPNGAVTNIPRPVPTTKNVDSLKAHSVYTNQLPTTSPKPLVVQYSRQRKRPSPIPVVSTTATIATTIPPRGKPKQRLPTRSDLDIKREQVSKSDESSIAPAQPSIPTATATARTLYNSSQYTSNHYDPYYALYDDDVELYRDVDYSQQNYNNAPRAQTTSYRGTPAPVVQSTSTREDPPKRGNSVYLNNYSQDIYQQSTGADYADDNRYDAQVDDQTPYRQSSRQPTSLRGDRNELNDVEEAITKRTTTTTTTRKTTTTTRTTTTTTTPRTIPPKKSTPPPPARTSSRGRGTAHYASTGAQITNNEVTVNTNRGTPAPRSRPTLKPSTSIVSKAQEFVDIYKFPPRRPDPIYPQPQPDKTAAKCRKDVCLLPDCSCGGKEIPGDIPVEQVPQIVLLTFDDSVNDLNKGLYMDLFEKGRTNPNGCPIAATFYVSHEWTDYSQVQNLYSDGHEIASHTVSHSFGEQFSQKKWTREVAGQREILSAYGGVHLEDVRGMRAPFLSVGGNKMFKMLYDSNFTYDSSMPIYENKPPSWPYTLDYKLFHDCMIPPCPTRSYPGVWEVPMVMWQDLNGGRCSMGDACSNPPDAEGVFKMLTKNFQRHYTTNRAPFGLFYHAAWFTQPHHKEGFINFIDSILAMKDVWLLTNWQAIQWVRDPTPVSRIGSFQPFQCDFSTRPKRCNNPKVCNLWHKSGVRYMRTCQPCPDIYPWTGNSGIRSSRIDNDIED